MSSALDEWLGAEGGPRPGHAGDGGGPAHAPSAPPHGAGGGGGGGGQATHGDADASKPPMAPGGEEEDDDDLLPPDLGLGTFSAEDIKWVDLEFLDLASAPPANTEKSRNKNAALGDNFPDIFFGDATSSLFNANFNIDDFKPFGEPFAKENPLDLESVEKNILADLFPPSASIEQSEHERHDSPLPSTSQSGCAVSATPSTSGSFMVSDVVANVSASAPPATITLASPHEAIAAAHPLHHSQAGTGHQTSAQFPVASKGGSTHFHEVTSQDEEHQRDKYPVPVEVLQMITKDLGSVEESLNSSSGQMINGRQSEFARPVAVPPKSHSFPSAKPPAAPSLPRNAVAKIAIDTDKLRDVTHFTVIPVRKEIGDGGAEGGASKENEEQKALHSFTVNTSNLEKATEMLKPMLKEKLPLFKQLLVDAKNGPNTNVSFPNKKSHEAQVPNRPRSSSNNTTDIIQIKEVCVDKTQASLKVLAGHGIVLDGMTCATTEGGQKYWICPESNCKKAYTRPSKLKIHLLAHKDIKPFKCPVVDCDWGFVTNSKLQRHLESHAKKKKLFLCRVKNCGAKFTTQNNLNKHHRHSHAPPSSVPSREFQCPHPDCVATSVRFPSSAELRVHERATHARRDSPPPPQERCLHEGCGKLFRKPSQLKAHQRTHTGSRPFACLHPNCGWAFATASKLRRHERSHRGAEARRHACHLCHRAFTRQEHLRAHLGTHAPAGRFVCAFADCAAKFGQKSSLYVHLRQQHLPALEGVASSDTFPGGGGRLRCLVEGCTRVPKDRVFHSKQELAHHVATFHKADFVNPVETTHTGVNKLRPNSVLLSQPAAGRQILAMLSPCKTATPPPKTLPSSVGTVVIDPDLLRAANARLTSDATLVIPDGSVLVLPSMEEGRLVTVDARGGGGAAATSRRLSLPCVQSVPIPMSDIIAGRASEGMANSIAK